MIGTRCFSVDKGAITATSTYPPLFVSILLHALFFEEGAHELRSKKYAPSYIKWHDSIATFKA